MKLLTKRVISSHSSVYDGFYVDAYGHVGGMALLFDKDTRVLSLSPSSNHIDVSVSWTPDDRLGSSWASRTGLKPK